MIIRELKAYAKGDHHSSSRSFSPPHLQFMTKVYHCNVASNGAICECLLLDGHTTANACQVLMYVYCFESYGIDAKYSEAPENRMVPRPFII